MIFRTKDDRLALLTNEAVLTLAAYAVPEQIQTEAGGIFIGSYRGPHLDVTGATGPMAGDRRFPSFFERMDPGHQAAARAEWAATAGTRTYLGEWHSHPEDNPWPSATDRRTWRQIMNGSPDPVLFLIVGRKKLWCAFGHRGTLFEAERIE